MTGLWPDHLAGRTSRSRAWLCAGVNQLAFPGLGTIMAGRRVGYVQAALMLVGFFLAAGFGVWFIFCSVKVLTDSSLDELNWHEKYQPYLWMLYSGLGLCALAWLWSLVSSLQIVRTAGAEKDSGTPPPLPR